MEIDLEAMLREAAERESQLLQRCLLLAGRLAFFEKQLQKLLEEKAGNVVELKK